MEDSRKTRTSTPAGDVQSSIVGLLLVCVLLLVAGCQTAPSTRDQALDRATVGFHGDLPVVHLSGTPYEIGYQHGVLMRDRAREHYRNAFAFMQTLPKFRLFTRLQVNWYLDRIWNDLAPHVPGDHLDEMRGLADGSGVRLADVHRAHAIPDAYPTQCSVGAFWGEATEGGRFLQFRNLDWSRALGVHNYGCVFVVAPEGKHRFVNLGFIGFIGALSGLNERGIAIGQIGSRSADEHHKGTSFVFLLRRILEEAGTADDAARIVSEARRTVGINYVVGSAIEQRAVAMETTARHFARFHDADPGEEKSEFAVPLRHAVFRADTAFDPVVRGLQTCSNGDPNRDGIEDPRGSSAYDKRYLWQADMAQEYSGRITTNEVFALAKRVAMKSNIQSVVYAWPEFWVAYARDDAKAAESEYHHFDLRELLGGQREQNPTAKKGSQ
jgi:isopenicillin-N N-acyltransferase-like protein